MSKASIRNYFKSKADNYDLVDKQIYWFLSDQLLWYIFNQYLMTLPHNFRFLDAGGGTGRWSIKILSSYPKSKGVIFDLSPEMLKVARQKIDKLGYKNRLEIICGDIEQQRQIKDKKFHISFNFHNVLGFVNSPIKALKVLYENTLRNGFIISLIPNLYHAVYFNTGLGRLEESEYVFKHTKGRFTKEMPYIHFFTPNSIKQIYEKLKLKVVQLTGFPTIIYPSFQETQIQGSTKSLSDLLSEERSFDRIFAIEKKLLGNNDIASRGNNIFIVGKKQ